MKGGDILDFWKREVDLENVGYDPLKNYGLKRLK